MALANFPLGNPAAETVRGQVSHIDANSRSQTTWEDEKFDYIFYEFNYDCSETACEFLTLVNETEQGFQWLGPSAWMGFSIPDVPNVNATVQNDWGCI